MNNKYILFLDIDGTLIDDFGEINKENLQFIKRNASNVVLCTGRNFNRSKDFLRKHDLSLDVICFNGGGLMSYNKSKVLCHIDNNDIPKIVEFLIILQVPFIVHGANNDYTLSCFDFRLVAVRLANLQKFANQFDYEKTVKEYCCFFQDSCIVVSDLKKDLNDIAMSIECFPVSQNDVDQISMFIKKLSIYYTSNSYLNNVEILPANADKGFAIKSYMKCVGKSGFYSIAVGDSNNDINLLKAVTKGYLVQSSKLNISGIKKLKSNNEDYFICEVLKDSGLWEANNRSF